MGLSLVLGRQRNRSLQYREDRLPNLSINTLHSLHRRMPPIVYQCRANEYSRCHSAGKFHPWNQLPLRIIQIGNIINPGRRIELLERCKQIAKRQDGSYTNRLSSSHHIGIRQWEHLPNCHWYRQKQGLCRGCRGCEYG